MSLVFIFLEQRSVMIGGHFSLKREANSNVCHCKWSSITFMWNLITNNSQNIIADRKDATTSLDTQL